MSVKRSTDKDLVILARRAVLQRLADYANKEIRTEHTLIPPIAPDGIAKLVSAAERLNALLGKWEGD